MNAPAVFGLGFWEIALILVVALLIFGPAKLPELAKSLGRGLREFRKATDEFKSTIDTELHAPDPDPAREAAAPVPEKLPDTVARKPSFGAAPNSEEQEAEIEPDDVESKPAVLGLGKDAPSGGETSESPAPSDESLLSATETAGEPKPTAEPELEPPPADAPVADAPAADAPAADAPAADAPAADAPTADAPAVRPSSEEDASASPKA